MSLITWRNSECPLSLVQTTRPYRPDRCLILGGLSSSSTRAFQSRRHASQTVALQTTKGASRYPRGAAGNFRWIILGPGKPVFSRNCCLNLTTLSHASLCVDWACMCDSPQGKSLWGMFSIFHLRMLTHLLFQKGRAKQNTIILK